MSMLEVETPAPLLKPEPRGAKRERAPTDPTSPTASTSSIPQSKKRRIRDIPIWAQPAKNVRLLAKYRNNSKFAPDPAGNVHRPAPTNSVKGPSDSAPARPVARLPDRSDNGPLGYLEYNIFDRISDPDSNRQVCDWLFQHIVFNNALGTSKVGEAPNVEGAVEIEAKLGTIVDKATRDRLRLPVRSEAVLVDAFEVGFESIMSRQQHAAFNNYLNEALKNSHLRPSTGGDTLNKPRVKIDYQHRYELDTFYPLSPSEISALPLQVQDILKRSPGRQPRVRVTRDQKTGKVIAAVIKARIADLHILSPNTYFDYRVSVNLEANWSGDVDALVAQAATLPEDTKKEPDRYKDRMSYTHQFCQIDLTQVKPHVAAPNTNASHELEVELDSSAVKEQGELVLAKQPNQYSELIGAFLANVRLLVRAAG